MRLAKTALLALMAFALGLAACGGAKPAPSGETGGVDKTEATSRGAMTSGVRPTIVEETLDNGLRVYMIEDRSAPLVSYQVWFEVGSVDEHEAESGATHGITGLSHFFEHMMFRGTEKHPDFFDAIYSMGGKLNAFTWMDETVYWENIPSQHLKTVIDMEADRLEHMTIDFLNLEPEREVVKSERLLSVVNKPSGLARQILQSRVFEVFPYHWTTIGWLRDLNAVTIAEAEAYYRKHYVPDNAYIIVVGDHDPTQTLAWIKAAYGHLPKGNPPEEAYGEEPPQTAERRDRLMTSVDSKTVLWGYRAPALRDDDYMVLELVDQVLTGTKTSRLQKKLVHAEAPKLGYLSSSLLPLRHPYMYLWQMSYLPGVTSAEIEAAVEEELERIVAEGLSEDELRRAVAAFRGFLVRQNLSNQKKAELMGFSLRTTDDPHFLMDRLDRYGSVTQEDIKRVVKTILDAKQRTVVAIIDPKRVQSVMGELLATLPKPNRALNDLGLGVMQLWAGERDLRQQVQNAADEAEAIRLLEERAARARASADEETKKKIDTYLADNEKGTVKRKALLGQMQEQIKTGQTQLQEARTQLRKAYQDLKARMGHGAEPKRQPPKKPGEGIGDTLVLNLAYNVLYPDQPVQLMTGKAGEPPRVPRPGRVDMAQEGAYAVLLAWVLEDRDYAKTAAQLRERALHLLQPLVEGAPPESPDGALIRSAFDLVWDSRYTPPTGEKLVDGKVHVAPTVDKPLRGPVTPKDKR